MDGSARSAGAAPQGRRARRLVAAVALAAAALLAAAPAALACEDVATQQALAGWGDDSGYADVPGGAFEKKLIWSAAGGPEIVGAVAPTAARGSKTAVRLRGGDSITSPAFCVDRLFTHVRFAATALQAGADLTLDALWVDDGGRSRSATLGRADDRDFGAWGLSSLLRLKKALPDHGSVHDVRLRLAVAAGSATWLVDDVRVAVLPSSSCPDIKTRRVFGPWGDESDYVQLDGGSFEKLTWSADGSPQIVEERNPFEVGGGSRAVRLSAGDSITSPEMCIDRNYPHLRFVVRAVVPGSTLRVDVLWIGDDGKPYSVELDSEEGDSTQWKLSQLVRMTRALPSYEAVRAVRLRFSVEGKSAACLVDDVFVDPMKRG